MRKLRGSLIATAALLAGCFVGATARDLVVPARAQGVPPVYYEYQVVDMRDAVGFGGIDVVHATAKLSQFGREGWHVVGVLPTAVYLERTRAWAPPSAQPTPPQTIPPPPSAPAGP